MSIQHGPIVELASQTVRQGKHQFDESQWSVAVQIGDLGGQEF